ncbi:hypothetical protein GW17_00047717 [Ensete ventricosum]|nr:hypothetical protein GW17_00047717 [Ensete ventricosum]
MPMAAWREMGWVDSTVRPAKVLEALLAADGDDRDRFRELPPVTGRREDHGHVLVVVARELGLPEVLLERLQSL